ncbi:DNA cytosine methyltransferase [Dyadobacter sp. OTU695]|uniref:DNA cytosine methyltransferase n=1 Tax=Dyadobacter sp. OTU695 TaxID=3043860 RepID=UPI00313B1C51
MQSCFSGIDLFAGAGGMSLGAMQSGIDVKFAVENDPHAASTYKHNFRNAVVFDDDIRSLQEIRLNLGNNVILFGGPPCQGFSTSNQKTRSSSNEKNWLFQEFVRVITLVTPLPKWVIFENVKGFSDTESGTFLRRVVNEISSLGYNVSYEKLNAVDFGIPQKRTRFFIVGNLHGIDFEFPAKRDTVVTVKDALQDLPVLDVGAKDVWKSYRSEAYSAYAKHLRGDLESSPNHEVTYNSGLVVDRYKHIPQGGNWQNIPKHLMANYKDVSRCHTGIYHRLVENLPSIVIGNYRKNMLIHPSQDRGLSVREAARLQSFPDWFEFKGTIGFQQQQVGNAVPPLLAKAVFKKILMYENDLVRTEV